MEFEGKHYELLMNHMLNVRKKKEVISKIPSTFGVWDTGLQKLHLLRQGKFK